MTRTLLLRDADMVVTMDATRREIPNAGIYIEGNGIAAVGPIAPIRAMRDAVVPVGIGVDGSASNDGGHLLAEARQALLLQPVAHGPAALTARQTLELATLGGARVLNRDDIGALAVGMSADCTAFDLRHHAYAGAGHDPVAALLFCVPTSVRWSSSTGCIVVRRRSPGDRRPAGLVERHNAAARMLVRGND